MNLKIELIPDNAPEIDLTFETQAGVVQAAVNLIGGFNELYGPFDVDKHCEVFGDLLEHFGQALTRISTGENPATVHRNVMGDDESNYKLTVTVTE